MRRTRRSASSPVSLFPFLAVLVSTMGALILLLIAINRRAVLQAIAKAAESVLAHTSAEEQWLNQRRQQLAEEVADIERELAVVRGDQQRVEEQVRLADQRSRSHTQQGAASRQELDRVIQQGELTVQEIAAIRQRLEAIGAAKARLLEEQTNADRAFVPVVHPGSGGTVRQPIYIECTADSLIIQPEGIALPPGALAGDDIGQSGFTRAIRALCVYFEGRWQAGAGAADNELAKPYPLLLVRPDGIPAFYAARHALEPLELPFGYDLIEADWMLRYPEPDPRARAAALAAMRDVRPGSVPGTQTAEIRSQRSAVSGQRVEGMGQRTASASPQPPSPLPLSPRGGGRGLGGEGDGLSDSSPFLPGTALSAATSRRGSDLEPSPATRPPLGERERAGGEPFERAGEASAPASPTGYVQVPARSRTGSPASGETEPETRMPADAPTRGATRSGTQRPAGPHTQPGDEAAEYSRLPNPDGNGKIPVARTIRIECTADKLVVGQQAATIALAGSLSPEEAVRQIFHQVQHEASDWGPAGTMFRWVPKLQFRVHRDALEMFYRMRFALIGCSLDIDHEIVMD